MLYEVSNRGGKGMLGFFNHATGSLDPTTDAQMRRRLPDEAGLHAAVGRLAVRSARSVPGLVRVVSADCHRQRQADSRASSAATSIVTENRIRRLARRSRPHPRTRWPIRTHPSQRHDRARHDRGLAPRRPEERVEFARIDGWTGRARSRRACISTAASSPARSTKSFTTRRIRRSSGWVPRPSAT